MATNNKQPLTFSIYGSGKAPTSLVAPAPNYTQTTTPATTTKGTLGNLSSALGSTAKSVGNSIAGLFGGSSSNNTGIAKTPAPSQPAQNNTPSTVNGSSSNGVSYTGGPNTSLYTSTGTLTPQQERLNYENSVRIAPTVSSSFSTPSSISSNPLSGAYNAIKGFMNQPLTGDVSQTASALGSTFSQPTSDSTTVSTAAPITQTNQVATQNQVKPSIKDQYSVITNDKQSDSATLKQNLDALRVQDQSETESKLQDLYKQLSVAQSQLAAVQAGEQPQQTPDQTQPGQQQTFAQTYNPESQSNISALTSQLQSIEDEIARAKQDSPEYLAAKQALDNKVAEEQMIRAKLQKGIANIEEQPIATTYLSGQSAALKRQVDADLMINNAQRIPLTQQVATEQAKKQAALDVAKTKYESAAGERSRLEDIYKTNYGRAVTVADKISDRAYEASKPVTLSAGQTRVDANGNVIASAPGKTTTTTSNSKNITKLKDALNNSKFAGPEADGKYADPSLYLANYQSWLASGQSADEFFRNFPPASYINPANTWLPQEIMQFVKKSSSSSRGAI